MADRDKKVVWLLGSGFSKSLGGPLLEELFDPHRWGYAKELFHRACKPPDQREVNTLAIERMERLHQLYVSTKKNKTPTPWRNAEEFLEMWEAATSLTFPKGARERSILEGIIGTLNRTNVSAMHHDLGSSEYWAQARGYS